MQTSVSSCGSVLVAISDIDHGTVWQKIDVGFISIEITGEEQDIHGAKGRILQFLVILHSYVEQRILDILDGVIGTVCSAIF